MPSLKCAHCGLVNWDDATTCKRCGSDLSHLSQPTPSVWKWYVAYCAFMAVMYLLGLVLGFYFIMVEPTRPGTSAEESRLMGFVFVAFGFLLSIPFAAGPFLPRRPWAWIFGLVLTHCQLGGEIHGHTRGRSGDGEVGTEGSADTHCGR
jgi:hypothetical protein